MDEFIAQTAKDYDVEYEVVDRYYKVWLSDFYTKLEEYIAQREEKNE